MFMNISLQDLSAIMLQFTNLGVSVLGCYEQLRHFCQINRFHTLQYYLTPAALDSRLQSLAADEILLLTDCFRTGICLPGPAELRSVSVRSALRFSVNRNGGCCSRHRNTVPFHWPIWSPGGHSSR